MTLPSALSNTRNEELRVMAAEVAGKTECGWYCLNCHQDVQPDHVTYQETHDPRSGGCGKPVSGFGLPDYLKDHTAARLLLGTLTEEEWVVFDRSICGLLVANGALAVNCKQYMLATPLQITVAVLVAKGKIYNN